MKQIIEESYKKSLGRILIPDSMILIGCTMTLLFSSIDNKYILYLNYIVFGSILILIIIDALQKITYTLDAEKLTCRIGKSDPLSIGLSQITWIEKVNWSWAEYCKQFLGMVRKNAWAGKGNMNWVLPGLGRDFYIIRYNTKYEKDCAVAVAPSEKLVELLMKNVNRAQA